MRVEKILHLAAVLLSLAVCAALGVVVYFALNNNLRADRLLAAGDYEAARVYYEKAHNQSGVDRCDAYELEERYLNARRMLQVGSLDAAREALLALGDYRDTKNLILACDYMAAGVLAEQGEYERAREMYLALGDYPGCAQRIEELNEPLYEISQEFADSFELEEACRLWRLLGDYADCRALLRRTEALLDWLADPEREQILDPAKNFNSSYYDYTYVNELGYLVVPNEFDGEVKVFLYYPGGRDEPLNIDFFSYYLMNPAPNTIALFLYRNGLTAMEEKNTAAIELLERAAAERGVFLREVMTVGSSLGAYPAMFSALYTWQDFGIRVPCVLSLDAGSDWQEAELLLNRTQCRQIAAEGTQFYLFESPWVGTDRSAIRMMVEEGMDVTIVGCVYDDHMQITFDAMGMGVIHWALGDRSEPCPLDIYIFRKLYE
ncbi:MAG: hypothetical protein IJV41_09740 [Oscillospiraceae bacterium]|nr:hypothetical protein [Oscillospiraceae bacterium]